LLDYAPNGGMVAVNSGSNGLTGIAQQMSGSQASLPKPSPLRIGHDDARHPAQASTAWYPIRA
jgi:hypothetical protein